MLPSHRRPTTPGEVLREEFMKPLDLTQVELAKRLGMSLQRLNGILRGRRSVTAETALLLSHEFNTSPELWLNLQNAVDLWEAAEHLHSTGILTRTSMADMVPAVASAAHAST